VIDVVNDLVWPERSAVALLDDVAVERLRLAIDSNVPLALLQPADTGIAAIVAPEEAVRLALRI
jgi:hypothetical protein